VLCLCVCSFSPRTALQYQGLLVSEQLLHRFSAQYHCPTALRLPQLDYEDSRGRAVQMLIIGDPALPAAIINDGPVSQQPGQSTPSCTAHPLQ
jgi:hypothetical protein